MGQDRIGEGPRRVRLGAAALVAVLWLVLAGSAQAYIYWGDGLGGASSSIGRANNNGTGVNSNFISGGGGVFGVAVDGSHIYWANFTSGSIGRANIDGTGVNQNFIPGLSGPQGITIGGSSLYWANSASGTIGKATLDGGQVNQNFIATGLGVCGDIAVDGQYIYWANADTGTIGRANLDGSGADLNFLAGLSMPCGVKELAGHLYWGNTGTRTIGVSNLNGTGANPTFIAVAAGPCGLTSTGIFIFWANTPPPPPPQISPGGGGGGGGCAPSCPVGVRSVSSIFAHPRALAPRAATGSLGRAGLDGSSPVQNFIVGAEQPCGVASDTNGPGGSGKPTIEGGAPPSVTTDSAAFHALVNPNAQSTFVYFQYGLDSQYQGEAGDRTHVQTQVVTYDQQTPAQAVGSGNAANQVMAHVSGLVPNAVYHVQVVATNGSGTSVGPDQTFKTAKDRPPPPPVIGRTANVFPTSGHVFVRPQRRSRKRFVPLTEPMQVKVGSELDTRGGTARVVTSKGHRRQNNTGSFNGTIFKILQSRNRRSGGLTTLKVEFNVFPGAPSFSICAATVRGAADGRRAGVARSLPRRVVSRLHSSTRGRYRSGGGSSSATSHGTIWDQIDRCDGTLTIVRRGVVTVFDFRRHRNVTVRAGHRYFAHR